jgi:hypothetical protein
VVAPTGCLGWSTASRSTAAIEGADGSNRREERDSAAMRFVARPQATGPLVCQNSLPSRCTSASRRGPRATSLRPLPAPGYVQTVSCSRCGDGYLATRTGHNSDDLPPPGWRTTGCTTFPDLLCCNTLTQGNRSLDTRHRAGTVDAAGLPSRCSLHACSRHVDARGSLHETLREWRSTAFASASDCPTRCD